MTASPSATFHRLTSYEPGRHWLVPIDDPLVRQDFVPLRPDAAPRQFKSYPDACPRVAAPQPWGHILRLSLGVSHGRRGALRRAASSAGNCHPIEAYLVASALDGLPDGVWHYEAEADRLVRIGPPPVGDSALVLTGIGWRGYWRYAERGYRHLWWDAGTVLAQMLEAAGAAGVAMSTRVGFVDADLERLLGLGIEEKALVAVTWNAKPSLAIAGGDAIAGDTGGIERFPLVENTHRSGRFRSSQEVEAWTRPGGRSIPVDRCNLVEAIERRKSAKAFDHEGRVAMRIMLSVVEACRSPIDWDAGADSRCVQIGVRAVDDLEPGWYRLGRDGLSRSDNAWSGGLATELFLDQPLAADAAFAVVLTADLNGIDARSGVRGYRAAQLLAGVGIGRACLTATQAGLGSRAMTINDGVLQRYIPSGHIGLLGMVVGRGCQPISASGPVRKHVSDLGVIL